ncbi:EAL domain-containing protein [Egicoccus sp. AB-alg6-2]|uniref:EAL domain-containing protein n=1 Tax=Egicoccus sp. AB-alg6-2 TaxID=3242692 RepID=UPI00359D6B7E
MSGFAESAHQAASIPAVMASLAVAAGVYLIARGWWSEPGAASRVVPVFYALVVVGAAICCALLLARARLLDDARSRWMATGITLAGLAALAQISAIIDLADAPLRVETAGLAALYLIWHAALVVFAVGAIVTPAAASLRRWSTLAFVVVIAVAVLDRSGALMPNLVAADGSFSPLYRQLQLGLTVASVIAAAVWIAGCGRRPSRPEVWLGVGLALAALDMTAAAGAERLFESIWWSSAALRAAQFLVPAAGLLADAVRLMGLLHRHESSLQERLEQQRAAAARLLEVRTSHDAEQLRRVESVLRERSFHPVFQPIYSLETGALLAVEALTRFTSEPRQGPDRWFAEAEQCGRGPELELAALDEALRAASSLPDGVRVAVNLSPAVVSDRRFPACLAAAPAGRVIVEITEHAPVDDYQQLTGVLADLRSAHDVLVAIDDAGAGFSSLRHIVQLGPDLIKLDMSLTRDIHLDPVRRALADSLVGFATSAGIRLVAEGVETMEELHELHELHVHAAQGYLLGRPGSLLEIRPTMSLPSPRPTAITGSAARARAASAADRLVS